jgi:hypothetical protein
VPGATGIFCSGYFMEQTLNKFILEAIEKLNAHKGMGYHWPANIDGSIGDVMYQDKIILRGNSFNHTYCCGLTLQAYLMAVSASGKDIGSYADVMKIRKKWFIADPIEPLQQNKGAADALVPLGFGSEVSINEAQPGDLVQLWRKNGSGHSVIFISTDGKLVVNYWSTQKSTNGIGYRTERLEYVTNPITHIHICRPLL